MTEKVFWTPASPKDEPTIEVTTVVGKAELTRTNSILYTYLGNLALFNHVYFMGSDDARPFYIFKTIGDAYDNIEKHMIRLGFPHFSNQAWVEGVDLETFEEYVKTLDKAPVEDIVQNWTEGTEEA